MDMREGMLFDKIEQWETEPSTAFGGFVTSLEFVELGRRARQPGPAGATRELQPLGRRSVQGYVAMFKKFVRWMGERRVTLRTLTPEQIAEFLDATNAQASDGGEDGGRDLNSEIRTRYLRLLERVYQYLKVRPNPAQIAAYQLHGVPGARGRDLPKEWLTPDEREAFRSELPVGGKPVPGESAKAWRRRRDRAMMALMIGAGPTVSEVIELYLDNIGEQKPDGSIPVTIWPPAGSETGREHKTLLRAEWAEDVRLWLEERKQMVMPSQLLFPATRKGGKVSVATIYRQVSACFERAGISVNREGGRTLRNTFAQRELEAGTSVDQLQEYLGLNDARSVERYVEASRSIRN